MLDTVRLAFGRFARPNKHYECRNCGTGLPREASQCSACGSSEVAIYEL